MNSSSDSISMPMRMFFSCELDRNDWNVDTSIPSREKGTISSWRPPSKYMDSTAQHNAVQCSTQPHTRAPVFFSFHCSPPFWPLCLPPRPLPPPPPLSFRVGSCSQQYS